MYCKMFVSTLQGTTLEWFVSLPTGHITNFQQFSKIFVEQYIVNKAPPRVSYDLFDIRKYQGESLGDCLNRFGAQMVRSPAKDEEMLVYAFKKGVLPGPFCEALIRAHPATSPGDLRWPTSPMRVRSPRREGAWPPLGHVPRPGSSHRGCWRQWRPRGIKGLAILMIQGKTRAGAQEAQGVQPPAKA